METSKQIKDRLIDALITAFVFAAALAWKDTLVAVLNRVLPGETTIWSDVIVTLLITAIVITLIYFIIKSDDIAEEKLMTLTDKEQEDKNTRVKSE